MFNFDDASKKSKETMDAMLKSYAEVAKGYQAIAAEASEYSKKSFQDLTSHMEALSGVKSVETAFELQSSFLKSSYEGYIAEANKLSGMYSDLAKTMYKPYEAGFAKAGMPVPTAPTVQ